MKDSQVDLKVKIKKDQFELSKLQKQKDKEIFSLKTQIEENKRRLSQSSEVLQGHNKALEERQNQYQEMKIALDQSETLVKDTQKIATLANRELSKMRDSNTNFISKINNEIEVLIKRKEYSIK